MHLWSKNAEQCVDQSTEFTKVYRKYPRISRVLLYVWVCIALSPALWLWFQLTDGLYSPHVENEQFESVTGRVAELLDGLMGSLHQRHVQVCVWGGGEGEG